MRKVNVRAGRCLAVLLWLLVLAAGEASRISVFALLAPVETSAAEAEPQQSPMVRRFERSLTHVQPLLERYGYGAAFAAVMVEGMGVPTPGQPLLMAGALEAAEGRMNIILLLFVVTAAATSATAPATRLAGGAVGRR